jgi:drug/metabolite transporter (DMT)-like permease
VISPFQYGQIVGSALVGVAPTGLWPDGGTWHGAAIIIGAGIGLAVVEGRRPRG